MSDSKMDKLARMAPLPRTPLLTIWLAINMALIAQETGHKRIHTVQAATGGGSMLGDVNISAILDSFSVSYDKRVRPNYGGPPVEVGVTMYVLSISSLSEVKMDFTLDFYFRQFWTDPRLAYRKRPGVETLSVGSEFIKNIWVPDTFFVNEKQSYFHIATTSNEFIRVHHSGSITRSIRLTITASCPMNLQYFPMDRQLCHIEIESFGYTMRDIRYKWNEGPNSVGVSSEVSLPQFKVLGHRQRAMEISLTTGNYSRLACEIQFVRSMGYYLIQIYIPSGLIVIISWVSFWLNRNATPARVALGVTTVLTMTTLMSSTNAALPKISYVKSIDVYLGTCFVMVFASLLGKQTTTDSPKNRFQTTDYPLSENPTSSKTIFPIYLSISLTPNTHSHSQAADPYGFRIYHFLYPYHFDITGQVEPSQLSVIRYLNHTFASFLCHA
nr:gamma-aminobutyric acid receptor subunit beta isoform X13 [Drosophila simulans]